MAKNNWEKEDKLLDYITYHRAEILRYLIVVLVGEIERFMLNGFLYPAMPVMQQHQTAFTFLLWAIPFFFACKLWVWKQHSDAFAWGMQGLKFIMCIFVVSLIGNAAVWLMLNFVTDKAGILNLTFTCVTEILYFIAMFKIVLQPHKK